MILGNARPRPRTLILNLMGRRCTTAPSSREVCSPRSSRRSRARNTLCHRACAQPRAVPSTILEARPARHPAISTHRIQRKTQ